MTLAVPDPMVSAEVDLRDFAFMPLDVLRLRDSELACVEDAEVFRCAVLSWCVSWHQVPASSMPDDDAVLARLLGFGRDVKGWRRVRAAGGMRGWVLCSDGRLYHEVVAQKARDAWAAKLSQRARTEAARKAREDARQAKSQPQSQPPPQGLSQTPEKSVTETVTESKGQGQGQGQGQGIEEQERAEMTRARLEAEGHAPTAAGLACRAMRAAGMAETNPGDPRLLALLAQGATVDELAGVAADAVARQRGFAWALKALEGRRADAAAIALAPRADGAANGAAMLAETTAYLAEQAAAAEAARTPEAQAARRAAMAKVGRAAA